MIVRISKLLLVMAMALLASLVSFGNLTDYGSNSVVALTFTALAVILLAGIRLTPSIAATVLFVVALSVSIWRYGKSS